jgi:hypothetical protein
VNEYLNDYDCIPPLTPEQERCPHGIYVTGYFGGIVCAACGGTAYQIVRANSELMADQDKADEPQIVEGK